MSPLLSSARSLPDMATDDFCATASFWNPADKGNTSIGRLCWMLADTWQLSGSCTEAIQALRPDCPCHMDGSGSWEQVAEVGWGCTLEASVRMSFESFTRHCRGTVTSITFAFSFLLLLSFTNFPYQAFTMISPGDRAAGADTGHLDTPLCRSENPSAWPSPARAPLPSHPSGTPRLLLFSGQTPASAEPKREDVGDPGLVLVRAQQRPSSCPCQDIQARSEGKGKGQTPWAQLSL